MFFFTFINESTFEVFALPLFLICHFLFFLISACSTECGDYHRICRAVKDPSVLPKFLEDSKKNEVTEYIKFKEFPQPNCNLLLFGILCPHSCGVCKCRSLTSKRKQFLKILEPKKSSVDIYEPRYINDIHLSCYLMTHSDTH